MDVTRRSFLKSLLAATGVGAALAAGTLPLAAANENLNAAIEPGEKPGTRDEIGALLLAVYLPAIKELLESEVMGYAFLTSMGTPRWSGNSAEIATPLNIERNRRLSSLYDRYGAFRASRMRPPPWDAYPARKVKA